MSTLEFNYLIGNHSGSLKSFAYNFTKNVEDAEDLLQDTLVKAIRYKDNFQDGTNFKGWLFTIMRNRFYADLRAQSRRPTGADSDQAAPLAAVAGAAAYAALAVSSAASPLAGEALLAAAAAALCGTAWAALALRSGSLLLPLALHAANNALASVLAAVDGQPGCAPAPRTPVLSAALALTLAIYGGVAVWLLVGLRAEVATPAGAAALRARNSLAFAYMLEGAPPPPTDDAAGGKSKTV